MLTIKNKEALIGYGVIGKSYNENWVVDDITEIVKQSGGDEEEYYVIKMQREDNNETKWVKLNRKMETDSPYYELSCGKQDGSGINKTLIHRVELENKVKLVNAIGAIIRMR